MQNNDARNAVNAWAIASVELGIELEAPFILRANGREHLCIAWLPHFFSAKRGVVVASLETDPVTFASDAESEGYAYSLVNVQTYGQFDRDLFINTLKDWGYYGSEEKKPSWYAGVVPWTP